MEGRRKNKRDEEAKGEEEIGKEGEEAKGEEGRRRKGGMPQSSKTLLYYLTNFNQLQELMDIYLQ